MLYDYLFYCFLPVFDDIINAIASIAGKLDNFMKM